MDPEKQSPDNRAGIFDNPANVTRLLRGLYLCCAILLLLELVVHRHIYHSWENLWGFYPLYGFVGCVVLVLIAKWMRTFLMRPEDYYLDNSPKRCAGKDANNKNTNDKDQGHAVDD